MPRGLHRRGRFEGDRTAGIRSRTRALLCDMRTTVRRRAARRSHHPSVTCDALGRWHWACQCGAGARGGASGTDWHWTVTAALVHQGTSPGE